MKSQKHWKIATVLAVIVAGLGWAAVPASGHVGTWAHNWTEHIKPRTDARYYTKSTSDARYTRSKLPLGKAMSGVWSAQATSGEWAVEDFNFDPPLPGDVAAHYATGPTAECPGVGQAVAGHLCVYPDWNYHLTFSFLTAPGPAGTGKNGYVMYMSSDDVAGNARGSWTVRAPVVASRIAPAPRVASGTAGH